MRIRIRIKQSDPDQIEKQDPDRYQSDKQHPDPYTKDLDPQHWFRGLLGQGVYGRILCVTSSGGGGGGGSIPSVSVPRAVKNVVPSKSYEF